MWGFPDYTIQLPVRVHPGSLEGVACWISIMADPDLYPSVSAMVIERLEENTSDCGNIMYTLHGTLVVCKFCPTSRENNLKPDKKQLIRTNVLCLYQVLAFYEVVIYQDTSEH